MGGVEVGLVFALKDAKGVQWPVTFMAVLAAVLLQRSGWGRKLLLDPVFGATVQATEEAVVNAMVAAEDMTGIDDHHVTALSHAKLREVLKKYNRLLH